MRRLVTTLGAVGMAVAAALPAAAQPSPAITVTPTEAPAGPSSESWSLQVRGVNFSPGTVSIAFAGQVLATTAPESDGTFSVVIRPAKRHAGTYMIDARQNPCAPRGSCEFVRQSSFRSVPLSSFNNPCGPAGGSVTLAVSGTHFPPESFGYVFYDPGGPDEQSRQRIPTGTGSFSASFSVLVPSRSITIRVFDVDQNQAPNITWRPAPCPATSPTTTPSTTETAERPTTPGSDPTTTSTALEVVDPPGPTVTVPPAVELPPETPGATLVVSPELGPPGFVTGAAGTGFPPGPVELTWEPGIGRVTTIAGPDGRFAVRVLVFPNDRIGSRALVATAGATTALDTFLVVPSTVKPSGKDVTQINRIRRFNSR